jgi:hypothetical protein
MLLAGGGFSFVTFSVWKFVAPGALSKLVYVTWQASFLRFSVSSSLFAKLNASHEEPHHEIHSTTADPCDLHLVHTSNPVRAAASVSL